MNKQLSLLSTPYAAAPPIAFTDPEETGTAGRLLEQAHETILKAYPKMHSMLVVRHGKLIFERYYGNHHAGMLNDLRSATKSFISLLTGIGIARGEISSTALPVADTLRHYLSARSDPQLNRLTLHHLLTMTSGFSWITGSRLGEPLVRNMQRSRRWVPYILNLPVDAAKIGLFQYRSSDSHLLSVILSECTGLDAFSYAKEYLFGPLDITHAAWLPSPEGHSMGHIGLYLTSRDMARLGICLLSGGSYGGRQVVPQEWLEASFQPHTDGYPAYGNYGYQFWNGRMNSQPYRLAHGHGGQQLWLLPGLDAAVIFTAESTVSRWRNPRRLIEQHIIPAMNP
ncbi:serine hydrolase domain-containing protein [Paenibacillus typhae]|uniref:CubicO group peptidase, beta-lactamase class C family n=1 Tax=Paenibacillus typhae TaxID=1174501 RepID=A0A1G9CBF7_9BACL|nr:serine hydrolase [Paenibacillus typhae]SDK49023.1 CubicO group peptidase, beta-lactamase class C family [Paenibacillus typhae]